MPKDCWWLGLVSGCQVRKKSAACLLSPYAALGASTTYVFSYTEKKKASSPQHNAHLFRRWVIKNAFHCTRQELCTCNTAKNPKVLRKSLLHTPFYFWTAFLSGYHFHSTLFHIIFDKTWHVLAFYHWIDCGCPTCLFLIKNCEPYGLPRQQRKCQLFTCYATQISHFHSLETHLRALLQSRRTCTGHYFFSNIVGIYSCKQLDWVFLNVLYNFCDHYSALQWIMKDFQ